MQPHGCMNKADVVQDDQTYFHETCFSVGKLLQKYTINYHNQHFYL